LNVKIVNNFEHLLQSKSRQRPWVQ